MFSLSEFISSITQSEVEYLIRLVIILAVSLIGVETKISSTSFKQDKSDI